MSLEDELSAALFETVRVAKTHDYHPKVFEGDLENLGGLKTARSYLSKRETIQSGLQTLADLGILSESMEAKILSPKFRSLFTKLELEEANWRLDELGYMNVK